MLKNYTIFLLIIFTALLRTCDEIDQPYSKEVEIDEPNELTRKAVIFDFTGIHCPNCPAGHEAVEIIDSVYHGHVIPISVHAGFFANPQNDAEPDFRTTFGTALYESIGAPNLPAAIVSSMAEANAISGATSSWQSETGQYIPDYAKILITGSIEKQDSLIEVSYDISERETVNNNLKLFAFIIEDSIQGPQAGVDTEIYMHRHLLRKSFTDIQGTDVNLNTKSTQKHLNTTIDPQWNLSNISIIGIIVDASTKEIYNAHITKLISN